MMRFIVGSSSCRAATVVALSLCASIAAFAGERETKSEPHEPSSLPSLVREVPEVSDADRSHNSISELSDGAQTLIATVASFSLSLDPGEATALRRGLAERIGERRWEAIEQRVKERGTESSDAEQARLELTSLGFEISKENRSAEALLAEFDRIYAGKHASGASEAPVIVKETEAPAGASVVLHPHSESPDAAGKIVPSPAARFKESEVAGRYEGYFIRSSVHYQFSMLLSDDHSVAFMGEPADYDGAAKVDSEAEGKGQPPMISFNGSGAWIMIGDRVILEMDGYALGRDADRWPDELHAAVSLDWSYVSAEQLSSRKLDFSTASPFFGDAVWRIGTPEARAAASGKAASANGQRPARARRYWPRILAMAFGFQGGLPILIHSLIGRVPYEPEGPYALTIQALSFATLGTAALLLTPALAFARTADEKPNVPSSGHTSITFMIAFAFFNGMSLAMYMIFGNFGDPNWKWLVFGFVGILLYWNKEILADLSDSPRRPSLASSVSLAAWIAMLTAEALLRHTPGFWQFAPVAGVVLAGILADRPASGDEDALSRAVWRALAVGMVISLCAGAGTIGATWLTLLPLAGILSVLVFHHARAALTQLRSSEVDS